MGPEERRGVDLAVTTTIEGLYCGDVWGRCAKVRQRRTFSVLEMDDVDAGMVGSVVADIAEVGATVHGVKERKERAGEGYRAALGLNTLHIGQGALAMSAGALYW